MEHTPFESSDIFRADYDPDKMHLHIEFHSKTEGESPRVSYEKVPRDLYDAFLKSDSKGKFYHANIKGRFPGRDSTRQIFRILVRKTKSKIEIHETLIEAETITEAAQSVLSGSGGIQSRKVDEWEENTEEEESGDN